MAEPDFSSMSDDELKRFISGEQPAQQEVSVLSPALVAAKEREAKPPVEKPDTTMGMSGPRLFAEGAALPLIRPFRGLKELGVGMFGSKEEIEQYNKEKAEQQAQEKQLLQNWPAKAGQFTTQAATAALLPARLGPQVGAAIAGGVAAPTQGPITGGVSQLPSRAMQGIEAGATTGAVGVPVGMLGKGVGAATGQFENPAMVFAGRAARRQGITPNTGALGGGPMMQGMEEGSAWFPKVVQEQANRFNERAAATVPVAGATLGTTTQKTIPGEGLRQSVVQAGDRLRENGGRMWNDLDRYITNNNLPVPIARDTQSTISDIATRFSPTGGRNPSLRNNEIFSYIENADTANNAVSESLRNMLNSRRVPTPSFGELHEIQSVVGKALARARYDADGRNAPASARQAVRELGNLYRSIESDIANWSTTNPTAGGMYRQAKDYWRDTVVPGVINNDIYQKASRGSLGASNRGYDEPRQFYSDLLNKREEAKALYPEMDQRGRDLITSLHTLPDMSRALVSPSTQSVMATGPGGRLLETGIRTPQSSAERLSSTARAVSGNKSGLMQFLLGHLPGAETLVTNRVAQELGMGRNVFSGGPLGRAAFAAQQWPQENLEEGVRNLRISNK